MRYLSLNEVIVLHHRMIQKFGGADGIRDIGGLESAIAQPRMTFGGEELYPTIVEKSVALGYSIVMNHPFVDGNKRVGHASMEIFLILNGYEITAPVNEQEEIFLRVASGENNVPQEAVWSSINELVNRIVDDALVLEYGEENGIFLNEIELEKAAEEAKLAEEQRRYDDAVLEEQKRHRRKLEDLDIQLSNEIDVYANKLGEQYNITDEWLSNIIQLWQETW